MNRACSLLLLALLISCSGCAMCSCCDDDTYANFGGKWERTDMRRGRVGSAFSGDGIGLHASTETDPNLAPEPSPEPESTPGEIDGEPEQIMADLDDAAEDRGTDPDGASEQVEPDFAGDPEVILAEEPSRSMIR